MSLRKGRSALIGALVGIATAVFAAGAQAAITPSLTLNQNVDSTSGTQAGAYQDLGMDLKFNNGSAYPVSDSPKDMSIVLPPGLLANATINGGTCLTKTTLDDNCQVGSGTVTAYAAGLVPVPTNVTFDLVAPPVPGDLAGLAVNSGGTQIGSTAGIAVRPSGDTNGVGVTITFLLPNTLDGAPIDITEINSTFSQLRYPTSCPSTPANVQVSVDSYSDSTVHNLAAPLSVTGCSRLPYAPKATVTAVKDSGDRVVAVTTAVTQAADESPSKNLSLSFPDAALGVNLAAVKLLCVNVSSSCTPVGTATATSPLYPTPLTANAYLTGTALGPELELVFPAPFPLKLIGTVALATKNAVFTGLPDIPLTNLRLVFNGGPNGMFLTNCNPGNGVADAASTDQNGDKSVTATIAYEISGCPAASFTGVKKTTPALPNAVPTLSTPALVGANSNHPALTFRVSVRKHAAKLTQVSLKLTPGISFVAHKVGKRTKITGVALAGAKIKSLAISHGRLVIKLRRPERSFRVRLSSVLRFSGPVIAAADHHKKIRVKLSVIATNTLHKKHTITKLFSL
ncbi:MAG TPA: hypothetical protein VG293_00545 [Solirubrobacteraceae bacterium]|nr:hypothetical protein [Solirubrobacteraceae bacterium]